MAEGDFVWPQKRRRQTRKEDVVKLKKTRGEEHVNHVGKLVQKKEVGNDCCCSRFQCFNVVNEIERRRILTEFLNLDSKNHQDLYLSGMMYCKPILRRRSRKVVDLDEYGSRIESEVSEEQDDAQVDVSNNNVERLKGTRSGSFHYKVRIADLINGSHDVEICQKAFLSIHAITRGRLRHVQEAVLAGTSPRDFRGKHDNRPLALPKPVEFLLRQHIMTFKPRQSHYSIRENPNKRYLPENLNVATMHTMFLEEYYIRVPYKSYWKIFSEYNISFGCPRSDTCSICDSFDKAIEAAEDQNHKRKLITDKELHLRKAAAFYDLKRQFKFKSKRAYSSVSVLSFDYMQNLPLPHLRTNKIFYSRQLWMYVFGIHNLSDDSASLYTYHEGMGKKGQNEVTSFLFDYLRRNQDNLKSNLVLISDGAAGQNKNFVMIFFLYLVVHVLRMFTSITYLFPMRGHSFLPNDQDFAIIEKKKKTETIENPEGWIRIMESCRKNPSPFDVVKVDNEMIFDTKKTVEPFFTKSRKGAVKLKGLRMYKIRQTCPFLEVKDAYSGSWRTVNIRNTKRLPKELVLHKAYSEQLAINQAKLKDLEALYPFITPESKAFYSTLNGASMNIDIDESDNSSGEE